jgi:hypothetical protein
MTFSGVAACRAGILQLYSTPLYTPRRTPLLAKRDRVTGKVPHGPEEGVRDWRMQDGATRCAVRSMGVKGFPLTMGVWQGVAMDSLKYYSGPPCPTLLRPFEHPTLQ